MKLILSFVVSLFLVTALNANCGMKSMHGENASSNNCKMHMQKQNCNKTDCKMNKKQKSCKMDMKCDKENCHMKKMKKDTKNCGCGMTVESCKKMMPHCEFRDGKKEEKK